MIADLIASLPGMDASAWERDLRVIASGVVDGCSIYPLILPLAAPLSHLVMRGRVPDPREPDRERAAHDLVDEILIAKAGFHAWTPVQLAAPSGRDRASYVRAWGLGHDVVGLGSGAFGRAAGLSYAFGAIGKEGLRASEDQIPAHPGWALALAEADGIDEDTVRRGPPTIPPVIERLVEEGWVQRLDGRFVLTVDGRFWAGNVAAELYAALAREGPPAADESAVHAG
ncbi:MAG: hypothetical protein WCJ30_21295 [Deltaproteobacteria bacterium]